MPSARSQEMLVRAATLYYVDGLSQAEVAEAIGVSRSNVSRVLAEARKAGIVTITITDPFGRAGDLEQLLQQRFGLREVRVARGADDDLGRVGLLGAEWLERELPHEGAIALSWGASVQAVVDAVEPGRSRPRLEVLPLVGGLSIVDSAQDGNVLVRSLATRLGANHRRLYAPAVVESATLRDGLLRESTIGSVLESAARAQIAVVGIGVVGSGASAAIVESTNLTADEQEDFEGSGAVGDCCTRFFDASGHPVDSPVDRRVVAIELDALQGVETVVAVAVGARKAPAVRAALRGGLADVLVIDEPLATALLAEA